MTPSAQTAALLTPYTTQVLEWQLGQAMPPMPCAEDVPRAQRTAERLVRTAHRAGHSHVLLLGLGDGTLASLLARTVPAGCTLLVLEESPAVARQVLLRCPELLPLLLVDTSAWALFLLCQAAGVPREGCALCVNPVQAQQHKTNAPLSVLEQWRRLFFGSRLVTLPSCASAGTGRPPSLSVACIAHPDETLLAEFFAQVPPWVAELVVLWDGSAPAVVPPCAVPVRQAVRVLEGDFAAQRTAMLELCDGDWCLYLDVDEALDADTWACVPAWMSMSLNGEQAGAVVLPRLTFMGDLQHARMGYGLWPDIQVRLFPLHAGLRFTGMVHEQLTGIRGAYVLAGGHAVLHYSHVRKNRHDLAARLRVFDAAGQQRHVLSDAYPALPVTYFTALREHLGRQTLLQLPMGGHVS